MDANNATVITPARPNYCHRCGQQLADHAGARFCPACGASLTPPQPLTPPRRLSAARYPRRMIGLAIDWLLLGVLIAPLYLWISSGSAAWSGKFATNVAVNYFASVAPFLYWALVPRFWGGRTVGRRLMGTRLVRAGDGSPVTYLRALGRAMLVVAMALLFFIPVVIDLLFPLFGRQQSLADRITDTLVTGRKTLN